MQTQNKPTPGQLAVQRAAEGRGFAPWSVGKGRSKASVMRARQAVKAAAKGGNGLDLLGGIVKGYDKLDHAIDYGGRGLHSRRSDQRRGKGAKDHVEAAIKALEAEKTALKHKLQQQQVATKLGRARSVVKKAGHGWLDWFDTSDRSVRNTAWDY
eukprot:CAMPEP_0181330856 /NCGR_PEP_ID=MMETSP1101-20121128/24156_1 /TAXON_ID=46948 /ORGANISM="Rhodomonas abbreviata, Strain Caron Lab Isolate" /LENGTH=154 /DNA_ID=CAMNT_0023440207 /DNA_START=123 /DNA_END=587 /DNA_ORIENTATION=-